MSGRWVPPAVRVVEHPCAVGRVRLVAHRGDRGRHRAEVHGDVLGLHHHLPGRVEQRRRGVAALLDVGRVRRADQHGAHLLAGGAQRAEDHLQLHRVDGHAGSSARRTSIAPSASTVRAPAGRHEHGRLGQWDDRRALERRAGDGPTGRRRQLGRRRRRRRRAHPHGHELDLLLRVAVAVALLVRCLERLAQRRGRRVGRPGHGQLERLSAVAQLVRRGDLGPRLAERGRAPPPPAPRRRGDRLGGQRRRRCAARCAARRGGERRDDEPERGEHARGARREHALDPQLLGDRDRVQRPGAAERDERVVARVDPALDGHDAQRARPSPRSRRARCPPRRRAGRARAARASAPTARSAAARSSATPPASGASPGRWPSSRFASVTVGSLAAAAVARRSRHGARRARADAQRAAGVAPGDRAAAGADGVDVERRQRDRPARDLARAGLGDGAVVHDAHVGRGAAHVEAQRALDAGRARRERGAGGAAGRAREDRPGGVPGGAREIGEAAVALHDRRLRQARLAARARRAGAGSARAGGRGPRRPPSSPRARTRGTCRRPRARARRARRAARRRAPRGCAARAADGGRRAAARRRRPPARRRRPRRASVAAPSPVSARSGPSGRHPLRGAEAQLRRRERRGTGRAQAVEVGARLAAELDDVGEALGRDERGAGVRGPRAARSSPTVMPCAKAVTSPGARPARASAASTAAITPSDWSSGVVGAFAVTSTPSPSRTASVNVPPTSTPSSTPPSLRGGTTGGSGRGELPRSSASSSVSARCWCDGQ